MRKTFDSLITQSPKATACVDLLKNYAKTNLPILLTGETGTGKSAFAEACHYHSARSEGPFIYINCANLQDSLLESELFGYEKGAFTGADRTTSGKIAAAHGGTLFLDEIGEMTPNLQAKLLHVIDSSRFQMVGGTKYIQSDFRLISATNRNLQIEINTSKFRKDLFYRLAVAIVKIPPLRERKQDIIKISEYILNGSGKKLDSVAIEYLLNNRWEGNIREISNVLLRAKAISDSDIISTVDLLVDNYDMTNNNIESIQHEKALIAQDDEKIEAKIIYDTLVSVGWVQTKAAKLLGISKRMMSVRVKKYGIYHESWARHHHRGYVQNITNNKYINPPSHDNNDLRDNEKQHIINALIKTHWKQKDAAKLLGITPRAINYKIKKYAITNDNWRINSGKPTKLSASAPTATLH